MQQSTTPYAIDVEVEPRFLAAQSEPDAGRYVFAYTIRIHNRGKVAARLIARHWHITDGNGRTEEVHGDGVVGEQPGWSRAMTTNTPPAWCWRPATARCRDATTCWLPTAPASTPPSPRSC